MISGESISLKREIEEREELSKLIKLSSILLSIVLAENPILCLTVLLIALILDYVTCRSTQLLQHRLFSIYEIEKEPDFMSPIPFHSVIIILYMIMSCLL